MENIPSNIKNFPLLNDVIFKRVFTKKEQWLSLIAGGKEKKNGIKISAFEKLSCNLTICSNML